MAQFEEIIKDNWEKFLAGTVAIGGGIWGWIRFRKRDEAVTDKSVVDAELSKFDLQVRKDKYFEEKEAKWITKIESLTKRLEQSEERQSFLQKQLDFERSVIQDLKSELTMYKTRISTER